MAIPFCLPSFFLSSPQEYVLEMKEDKKDKAELAAGKQN